MPRDDVLVPNGGLSGAPEDRRHDLASDLWTNRPLRDDRLRSALYTGPTTWPVPPSRPPPSYQTSDDLLGARVRIACEGP